MSDHAPWRARPERMKMFVHRWPGLPWRAEMLEAAALVDVGSNWRQ
jgi:hypothetical protein